MPQFVGQRGIRICCIILIILLLLVGRISGTLVFLIHIDGIEGYAVWETAWLAERIILAVGQAFQIRITGYLVGYIADAKSCRRCIGILEGIDHHIDVVVLVPGVFGVRLAAHELFTV